MTQVPAKTGWQWIRQGAALFRKQPLEISTMFLGYMFLTVAGGIIPVLGQILPLMLVPVFSMSFMQACVQLEEGKRIYPNLLLSGFRLPAFRSLLWLGVLYLLCVIGSVAASAIFDGGVFWQVMIGAQTFNSETLRDSTGAMLFAALLFTPVMMAFWFAAPLVAWQNMTVGKAIFYSFFAVLRASRAFLVYSLAWFVLGVLVPVILSALIAVLTGKPVVMMAVLLPLSLVMTVIMYCSFYPMYTTFFGKPGAAPDETEKVITED
jgi:hypothetical protein